MDKNGIRTSAAEARALLGLAPPTPDRHLPEKIWPGTSTSVSLASSADSADVAGGRGSRSPATSSSTRGLVSAEGRAEDAQHYKQHPSRALWEGRASPSPSPTPYAPPYTRPSGGGGGGGGEVATDKFWSTVLPEDDPVPSFANSSLGDAWSWQQQQQQKQQQQQQQQSERLVVTTQPVIAYGLAPPSRQEQQLAAMAVGGVDRPAARGQEYRREKKSWWVSSPSPSSSPWPPHALPAARRHPSGMTDVHQSSSLMRSGSELDEQQRRYFGAEGDASNARGFLGIRWTALLPGATRSQTTATAPRSDMLDFCYSGGDGPYDASGGSLRQGGNSGDFPVTGGDGRLQVQLGGAQELGRGLGGHTAYRIQVTDRAIGEQWVVLRRFRQFEELHRGLLSVLSREPDANAYVLPPKEVFGGRHGGVIAKRLKLLKVYLNRLVTCSAAVKHHAMSSFLELDPALRGLGAYGRQHGPECILKEGPLRMKVWKGPHKPVINMLEAGLGLLGWTSGYAIVSPGPVFLVYRGPEDDPEKPLWTLPDRRTIGSQVHVRRVDMWKSDLEKEGARFFLVSWENTSLLCQVESESSLESWTHAIDEGVDLRPQQDQSEEDKAKVDIELKAKEAWNIREEGLWGGL
ncbi:unnamed protein product [Scytosiphon promiscuus]